MRPKREYRIIEVRPCWFVAEVRKRWWPFWCRVSTMWRVSPERATNDACLYESRQRKMKKNRIVHQGTDPYQFST